jgi:hypothetical protein
MRVISSRMIRTGHTVRKMYRSRLCKIKMFLIKRVNYHRPSLPSDVSFWQLNVC